MGRPHPCLRLLKIPWTPSRTDFTLVSSESIHGNPDRQPSIVAGDETPRPTADLASADFAELQGEKATLQLVERATDVFPPLKSTVAGLLGVIDIMEVRDFQLILAL